jgi:hypothetical protein
VDKKGPLTPTRLTRKKSVAKAQSIARARFSSNGVAFAHGVAIIPVARCVSWKGGSI